SPHARPRRLRFARLPAQLLKSPASSPRHWTSAPSNLFANERRHLGRAAGPQKSRRSRRQLPPLYTRPHSTGVGKGSPAAPQSLSVAGRTEAQLRLWAELPWMEPPWTELEIPAYPHW